MHLLVGYSTIEIYHSEFQFVLVSSDPNSLIAGVLTAGLATIPVAAVSGYRAHAFEKNFWNFIQKTLSDIGKGNATMSELVTVTP